MHDPQPSKHQVCRQAYVNASPPDLAGQPHSKTTPIARPTSPSNSSRERFSCARRTRAAGHTPPVSSLSAIFQYISQATVAPPSLVVHQAMVGFFFN
ncbi:hypothetical protein BVRB_007370 [Beta vulgaris subsp. vulgaris]|uniref:Uncharacterized protein n=1 Tax=Beta vulgaris subsp. vulgaris TaxID=3555 RepID=A0A0J8DXF8_BETVV|nr:hypothetical protein BVRB_007370 [Beta vulgaris subsp. vulgaris]